MDDEILSVEWRLYLIEFEAYLKATNAYSGAIHRVAMLDCLYRLNVEHRSKRSNRANPTIDKSRITRECWDCGLPISKAARRCTVCSKYHQWKLKREHEL